PPGRARIGNSANDFRRSMNDRSVLPGRYPRSRTLARTYSARRRPAMLRRRRAGGPMTSPPPQGLYDPAFEHDSCGVAFVADVAGRASHQVVAHGLAALLRMDHRGARGAEPNTGDGAGITIQVPDALCRAVAGTALP